MDAERSRAGLACSASWRRRSEFGGGLEEGLGDRQDVADVGHGQVAGRGDERQGTGPERPARGQADRHQAERRARSTFAAGSRTIAA